MYTFNIPFWRLITILASLQMIWIIPIIGLKIEKAKVRRIRNESVDAAFKIEEKAEQRKKLEELFPHPWLAAYEECQELGTRYQTRKLWFTTWLAKVGNLPLISAEAVKKLALMIGLLEDANYSDRLDVIKTLTPYLNFPGTKKSWENKDPAVPKSAPKHCPHGFTGSLCSPKSLCLACREVVAVVIQNFVITAKSRENKDRAGSEFLDFNKQYGLCPHGFTLSYDCKECSAPAKVNDAIGQKI